MNVELLEWDTDYFGIKTGKVEIMDESFFHPESFKEMALDENYELIYVFKYGGMLSWEKAIKANIELMDIMLTMSMKFDKNKYLNLPYTLRNELAPKELEECYRIAEQVSIVSRFYNERLVGPTKTRSLYRKWIDNTINRTFSDGIFINTENDIVNGIHIIKTDRISKVGYFTLTGADINSKGKGIGTSLWLQSFSYWANNEDIKTIKSPFSFKNIESFGFHLKNGFTKIEEVKYIYHYRRNI